MRTFFIQDTLLPAGSHNGHKENANRPEICGKEAEHIRVVLRMQEGEKIHVTDGRGRIFLARIHSISNSRVKVDLEEEIRKNTESPLRIRVAPGFLKDKKMDTLVRHLTELGVDHILPFFAMRSIPRPDEKRIQHRINRWQAIAQEAVKQCGRTLLPEITVMQDLFSVVKHRKPSEKILVFYEGETSCLGSESIFTSPAAKNALLVIFGPEGGFSEEEILLLKEHQAITASLGPRILRSETACISGVALVQHLFGDMGRNRQAP